MKILGIESSCDDTCAAVVENGVHILSNTVSSQINIFASYGGVIPEVAARSHLEAILPIINQSLKDAHCTWSDIDAIAVTHTPGLLGSLLIGTLTARTLAILHDKPLYAVHHLKSHVYANWLNDGMKGHQSPMGHDIAKNNKSETIKPSFPALSLIISGGHTQILYMPSHNSFKIIGTTLDDAVGECFDKVAKTLGLPYPGGPAISILAKSGDPKKYPLPCPKTENPYNFSFSGLKTAVLRTAQNIANVGIDFPSYELKNILTDTQKSDLAASFEHTAVKYLINKLSLAQQNHPEAKSLIFAGGVSANERLRKKASELLFSDSSQANIFFPNPSLSGDNGAMVASAAYFEILSGTKPTDPYSLNISPRSSIENSAR